MPNENDQQLVALVPYTGKPPENSIMEGCIPQVMENIPQSKARMEALQRFAQAKKDAEETERFHDEVRARALEILGNGLTRLSERIDAFEARRHEHMEQQKRIEEAAEAAAAEAEANAEYSLPYDAGTILKDATHMPTGDLHSVGPVDKEHLDPEGEARSEALSGATPQELDKGAPPPPGDYLPTSPAPSPYRNPVAIGLN
jgi:hypothetical protein